MGSVLYLHISYRGWVDNLLKKSSSVHGGLCTLQVEVIDNITAGVPQRN